MVFFIFLPNDKVRFLLGDAGGGIIILCCCCCSDKEVIELLDVEVVL